MSYKTQTNFISPKPLGQQNDNYEDQQVQSRSILRPDYPNQPPPISLDSYSIPNSQHNSSPSRCYLISSILLICLCTLVALSHSSDATDSNRQVSSQPKSSLIVADSVDNRATTISRQAKFLPKIFWLYTYQKAEGETAMNRIMFDYLNHTAVTNGYEVRIVDSWTAYDWLSSQMVSNITKTIQNTKLQQNVCSLLKLALLIEHGGILVGSLHLLFVKNDFSWVEKMFETGGDAQPYRINPGMAEVYVPVNKRTTNSMHRFRQDFIVAIPKSRFLLETFATLQKVITSGELPYNDIFNFMKHNGKVNIDYLPLSIASVMTVVLEAFHEDFNMVENPYHYFRFQSKKKTNYVKMDDLSLYEQLFMLKEDTNSISHLKEKDMVLATFDRIQQIVDAFLINKYDEKLHEKSLLYQLLSVPANERIFLKPLPKRLIEMCVVFADGLEKDEAEKAKDLFMRQSYANKQLVIFTKFAKDEEKKQQRRVVMASSGNEVRNIEIALTQHCNPRGYAVLLKSGESFNTDSALQVIARSVDDRSVLSASLNLVINNTLHEALPEYHDYSRSRDGTINPKINKMNGMLNHIRVFSIEAFRYVPQLEWRDTYGVYMQDRIIIFETLLELLAKHEKVNKPEHRHKFLYMKRRYADLFHFPSIAVIIGPEVTINAMRYEEVSLEQIERTKYRFDVESIELSMVNCQLWGVPFSKMVVYNPGTPFIPIDKKTGPELIPKVMHQAWLGGQLPYAKQYFYDKAQRLYPDYKMVLWSQKNITRQNFPDSYDIIQNLLEYQRSGKSVYRKYATITDLVRHELMYRNGGFWRDAGMNLFNSVFNQFTRYKLVIGGQVTIGYRWNQGMCFYANQPKSQHMYRVSNYRNVNRMQYYHYWAVAIAGPIDFRQVLDGLEQYSPSILIVHFEYFYPAQAAHPYGDSCLKKKDEINSTFIYEFEYKGWVKVPDCQKNYPIAFGQDHNMFGVSWQNPQ